MRRSDRTRRGAGRARLTAAALSLLLAVALTLAGAIHTFPYQGSANSSSDKISKSEAFVSWICGPGTSTDQQTPADNSPAKQSCPACTLAKAPGLLQVALYEPVAIRRLLSTLRPLEQIAPTPRGASSNPPARAPPLA